MHRFTIADLQKTIDECLGSDSATAVNDRTRHEQFGDLGHDSLSVYELVTRLQDGLRISTRTRRSTG